MGVTVPDAAIVELPVLNQLQNFIVPCHLGSWQSSQDFQRFRAIRNSAQRQFPNHHGVNQDLV